MDNSIGVRALNIEYSDSENEDCPLRASEVKDLRHPAKPLYRSEVDLDAKIVSNEDPEGEEYHNN